MKMFKVGQKVRVIGVENTREACGRHALEIGSELEIQQYDSCDNTYLLGAINTDSWVHADDLEDVEDTPEFDASQLKEGDKVQLKEGSVSKYGWAYNGEVKPVTHARPEELVLGARVRVLEENKGEIPVGTLGTVVFHPTDSVPGVLWVKEGTRGAAWVGYVSHEKLQLLSD